MRVTRILTIIMWLFALMIIHFSIIPYYFSEYHWLIKLPIHIILFIVVTSVIFSYHILWKSIEENILKEETNE